MSTNPTYTPQETLTHYLLSLAKEKTLLNQIEAEQQVKVEVIKRATAEVSAPTVKRVEELEQKIKALALEHKATLFEKKRTFCIQGHTVKLTKAISYEVDDDAATIALIEEIRDSSDPEKERDRMAAAACLNVKTTLNLSYVRSNWKQFAPWFQEILGFRKKETDSPSIKLALTPSSEA